MTEFKNAKLNGLETWDQLWNRDLKDNIQNIPVAYDDMPDYLMSDKSKQLH